MVEEVTELEAIDSDSSLSTSGTQSLNEDTIEVTQLITRNKLLDKEKKLPTYGTTIFKNIGGEPQQTSKRKRKRIISVCLQNCRYEVIRKTVDKFGFKEAEESENWNLYWTDMSISIERCKDMKRYQKINHFPGMLEICRKDLLARNLNRMLKLFPADYNFFPKTWCLPADLGEALTYSRIRKNKTFILKPDCGSQGRGIFICKNLREIKPTEKMICQVYLTRPFLIDGYKFDLRVYALVTSCDPLRIYVYNEGLVRFATSRYKEPTGVNITNVFMHLTNYAVNKHSRTYNQDTEVGSKRKLSWLNSYLHSLGHDVDRLWLKIDDVIIKTIFCAWPVLKHSYAACFPGHDIIPACCELLGVDIILDRRLNPQVLEVNHSPSFHTDTGLDCEVKEPLLHDMFKMMNLENVNKAKVLREERKRVRERLLNGLNKEPPPPVEHRSFEDYYKYEMTHRGGYRLVFPNGTKTHTYAKYFNQGQGSLYCDTAASRARESAQTALREEMILRARLEAAKRLPPPGKAKLKTESPRLRPTQRQPSPPKIVNSFEPQTIVEAEEKERMALAEHRAFLVRTFAISDHVFLALKKNGALRPQDERKYILQRKQRTGIGNADNAKNGANIVNEKRITDFLDGLQCGGAVLMRRPDIPPVWDGNLTRGQVARTLSNNIRISATNNREMRNSNNPNVTNVVKECVQKV